jgi:D-lactate dehydrogenase (cytochrome)
MRIKEFMLEFIGDESRIFANDEVLIKHSKDMTSYHCISLPEVVLFPINIQEISAVVDFASKRELPIIPFGLGTSVEGQLAHVNPGISINMTKMNDVIEIRPDDFMVTVQAGVTRNQLNQELKKHNLFFPVDPAIDATLGGMAATNASGTTAVRYGTMKDQVLGMQVLLGNGELIRTGGKFVKSSAGYNLTSLFVGSEGTLGIITELILRVYPIPEYTLTMTACFDSLDKASNAVVALQNLGLAIGCMEIIDEYTVSAINAYKDLNLPLKNQLLIELNGKKSTVLEDLPVLTEVLESNGSSHIMYASDKGQREKLWAARHEAALAILSLSPGKRLMTTDVCVPITVLPKAIEHARKIMQQNELHGAIVGHAGDGNFHAVFAVDPQDNSDINNLKLINEAIVDFAINNEGTCSGEHGIGLGKMKHLQKQHGDLIPAMRQIKLIFDPANILNPGKIFN